MAGAPEDRFRILAVDGGGIRGLIPALVLAELEKRLQAHRGAGARVSDYFHMLAGTSTGGLVALSLTAPDPAAPGRPRFSAADLAALYTQDGPAIFRRTLGRRLATLWGLVGPKYPAAPLAAALERRLGDTRLDAALRDLVVCAYDMTAREPYVFKRWRARESADRNQRMVAAGLATAAAPTYFPAQELAGHALVDGGVFANDPTIAAIAEALKRGSDPPAGLVPDDLLVVSIGTGRHEDGFTPARIRSWGELGWILPRGGEPPLISTLLGGSADGVDHWAHALLNHPVGPPRPEEIGRGPRYFRWQVDLRGNVAMDDAGPETLERVLPAAADELVASRSDEIDAVCRRLLRFEPLPHDPPR
jgi:patatin-like phospholipase/acyl hydrolase